MNGWRKQVEQRSLRLLQNGFFWAALVTAVFAANAMWCARNRLAGDVAWYLYAVQRITHGAILYRDIQDINMPVVYLLYLPLAWLQRLSGLPIEAWLYGAIWCLVGALLLAIWRIPELSRTARGVAVLSTAFAALTLNRFQLGQRDPVCAFLFGGLVVATYVRIRSPQSRSEWPSWIGVAAAGLGMAMKPHFLLPWALLSAALVWHVGARRAVFMKECWAPFAISAVSWIVTLTAFPDFVTMVKVASRYYSGMNVSAYEFSPLMVPLLVAAVAFLRKTESQKAESTLRPLILLSALATAGFSVECIAQGKGFPYHLTPAMFWGTVTAGLLFVEPIERGAAGWRMPAAIVSVQVALVAYSWWTAALPPPTFFTRTNVEEFVTQHARGRTVLTLSTDLRTGFPLILEADATNARADAQLWTIGALYQDQVMRAGDSSEPVAARYHTRAEMSGDERFWFDEVVRIVTVNHPAVILVQTADPKWGLGRLRFDFIDYFSTDERFKEALRPYKRGPANDQRLVLFLESAGQLAGSRPPATARTVQQENP